MEESTDVYLSASCCHAGGVLLIGFLLVITGIEAAKALEIGTSSLAQFSGKGEAEIQPVLVVGGNIDASRLDALGDDFNVAILKVLRNSDRY